MLVFSAHDAGEDTSAHVSAALVKARTSNEDLVSAIRWVIAEDARRRGGAAKG